jgi:hypothetical protein
MSAPPSILPPASHASLNRDLLAKLRSASPKSLWLLGIWAVYSSILGALYVVTPPSPDISIFDYIGWRAISGDRLYVDVIEQNWPGAMWLHTLAVWAFGNHLWTFRLFDYALMMAGAFSLLLLGASGGFRWTGFIAVPLYQMMYVTSSPWLTGQRDIVAGHALILLSVLYLRTGGASRMRWMCLFGVGVALATMTRPTYLLFPVSLLVLDFVAMYGQKGAQKSILKDGAAAVVGALATLTAVATYGAYSGGLQGWYDAAVLFNLSSYSGTAPTERVLSRLVGTATSWHWYYAFSAVGILLWLAHGSGRTLRALACIALTVLVSFFAQGKAFGYHLAGLLPIMALLCAQTVTWAGFAIGRRSAPATIAIAAIILLIVAAGSVKKIYSSLGPQANYLSGQIDRNNYLNATEFDFDGMALGDAVVVSEFLSSYSKPSDTVLVWNRGIIVNFLSERRSPVPYATVGMLLQFRKETPLSVSWISRLDQTLRCTPPKYVILGKESVVSNHLRSSSLSSFEGLAPLHPADAILAKAITKNYRKDRTVGGAHVWVLKDDGHHSCQ